MNKSYPEHSNGQSERGEENNGGCGRIFGATADIHRQWATDGCQKADMMWFVFV